MGEKWVLGAVEGREPWSCRKVKESGAHREMHKKNTSPKLLAEKTKGMIFVTFCYHWGSKTEISEVPWLSQYRNLRTLPYSWSRDRHTTLGWTR